MLACRVGGVGNAPLPAAITDLTDNVDDSIIRGLAQENSATLEEPDLMEIDSAPPPTHTQRTLAPPKTLLHSTGSLIGCA
jgi:hypothetical protein